jgi:glycerol-1-phosphate dehydrogenase [NAD(P)+]
LHGTLREVFVRLGLPTKPSDLGFTDDLLREAIVAAPATRPDRYTVLSETLDDAGAAGELIERAFA